jgi:hypothetical protein
MADAFEEPDALFSRHLLIGHQQGDFVSPFPNHPEARLSVDGGEDAELVLESPLKILQRLLFVIDVKNEELLIIVSGFRHEE